MLSIGKLARGTEGYYLNAVAKGVEDYYLGSGEALGWWVGSGSARLGLRSSVTARASNPHWSHNSTVDDG